MTNTRRTIFLLAGLLTTIPALAGDLPNCPERPIRVGFFEFGMLFNSERGDKSGTGIDRDLVKELEKRSTCRFEGSTMTRARIWTELQAGRLDLTLAAVKTPEREALAWMIPYLQAPSVMLLSTNLPPESRTQTGFLADPKAMFGMVRGFRHAPRYEAIITQMRAAGRLIEATDEASLATMLKRGTVMAMVSNTLVYPRYISDSDLQKEVVLADWGPTDPLLVAHIMFAKQSFSPAEADKWRALLAAIRRDGTLQAIAERQVGRDTARRLIASGN